MKAQRFATLLCCVVACGGAIAPSLDASEDVRAALSQRVVMASSPQTVYLKVGMSVEGGAAVGAAANVAIVLDRSGSMQGEKIVRAREAALSALDRLGANDIVSVLAYDDSVRVLLPATRLVDRGVLRNAIEGLEPGGSTALFAGVSRAAGEIRKFLADDRVNRIILLSDGIANVGPDRPEELGSLGVALKKQGISVSTIGLGLGYNEDLMSRLATRSDGNHVFVEHPRDLAWVFDKEFGDLLSVAARDVLVRIECVNGTRPVRVLGRDAEIAGSSITLTLNQLYANHEKYLLVELEVPAGRDGETRHLADVNVRFARMTGGGHAQERRSRGVGATFSSDAGRVERSEDEDVMVAVVENLVSERNLVALSLRDQGKIDEARELLLANTYYAEESADRLGSERLEELATQNRLEVDDLEREDWKMQRKRMIEKSDEVFVQRPQFTEPDPGGKK